MTQIVLIGLAAGAASALLFASIASGALLSAVLFYFAPLPIMIAAIGWSHLSAAVAALAAAVALAAVFDSFFVITFLVGMGLPAWLLGYLALLARPSPADPDVLEWYPIGHLVVWAAAIGALVVALAVAGTGFDAEAFRAAVRQLLERLFRIQQKMPAGASLSASDRAMIEFLVTVIPPALAISVTQMTVLNLWLAGQVVRISGRLKRPFPEMATLRLPGSCALVLAAGVVGAFLPGLPGLIAILVAASFAMAYALVGFAVLHALTIGIAGRRLLLGATYVAAFLLGWPLLPIMALGLADAVFDIRGRLANKRGPPASRT